MAEEYIQSQIESLTRSLNVLEEKKREIERQALPIRQELELWTALEKVRSGAHVASAEDALLFSKTSADAEERGDTGGYGWKTQKLRDYVWEHRERGSTIRELSDYSVSIGAKPNYPYNWIRRLSEGDKPEITKRGDRIFPTEFISVER